ncbi:MAG: sulfatase-like hydrolase/transferase [Chitinivibrionales bacterium]|nr:sulfatase-like hydrolase/transferase [Chitinivibrionales bacterium]
MTVAKHPNVLLITWHDAGRWFGCYGNDRVHTPNVDRLADAGVRFANMFSACAICSPSRAAIVTGRYCQDNGVMFLTNTVNNNRLHPHERHVARVLKEDHGYRTALFGVQHECAHEHVHEVMRVDEQFDTDPWPTAQTSADRLCTWLTQRRPTDGPFYAQWGLYEAHLGHWLNGEQRACIENETDVHIPPYLLDTPQAREAAGYLQGMLRYGDRAIGTVLDTLRDTGLDRDTLVVMCVDHGVGLPRAKTTCYDPGIAVGWLMRLPGVTRESHVVEAMATQVDVLPTMFGLLDLPAPDGVQGQSFASHARGNATEERNDKIYSHMVETVRSIRTHHHKLIRNFRPPRWPSVPAPVDFAACRAKSEQADTDTASADVPHVELYDLHKDPNEFTDVAKDPAYARVRTELDAQLWDFLVAHDDFVLHEPVRTPWQAHTQEQLRNHLDSRARPRDE